MRAWRRETGQTAAEYMGVLLVTAVIVLALASSGLGKSISCHAGALVQTVAGLDEGECRDAGPRANRGPDRDRDGLPDAIERKVGSDPRDADSDGDGLSDGEEARRGSLILSPDSDRDGVSDADEADAGSDPRFEDADADGLLDPDEIELGTNPRLDDSDADGVSDNAELAHGTDPLAADSDGDGKLDGEDSKPKEYDSGWREFMAGYSCGESTARNCPDDDHPARTSEQYLAGQIFSGVTALGDVRDALSSLLGGKPTAALWSVAAIAPILGDSVKVTRIFRKLSQSADARRRAAIVRYINKHVPADMRRTALDAVMGGGYSKLLDRGIPESTVRQLAEEGNDLGRLTRNALVNSRSLDEAANKQVFDAAKANPPWKSSFQLGEALGVETALAELKRRGHYEILIDGRPRKDGMRHGPDIVAVDKITGRTVIVEAKGSVNGVWPTSGRRLKGTRKEQPDGTVTGGYQTSAGWLRQDSQRYLDHLRRSKDPRDQEAADRLEDIVQLDGGYDAMVINSSPAKRGGYGAGMDEAAEHIREGGQVGHVEIVDIQRPK